MKSERCHINATFTWLKKSWETPTGDWINLNWHRVSCFPSNLVTSFVANDIACYYRLSPLFWNIVYILPVKFKSIDYSPEMLPLQLGLIFGAAFYSFFVEICSTLRPVFSGVGHVWNRTAHRPITTRQTLLRHIYCFEETRLQEAYCCHLGSGDWIAVSQKP